MTRPAGDHSAMGTQATAYRIGAKDIMPGRLLTDMLAACPDLAAFLEGCGSRDRTAADFDLEGRPVHVDDWSRKGPMVCIYLDLAADTSIDFTLTEGGAAPVELVYCGRDAERAYALDDAGQEGATLTSALGSDIVLPTFLQPHADLKIVTGDYMPIDAETHQTSLTLAEPGSGSVSRSGDGGESKGKNPVAAYQAMQARVAEAAKAAHGR
jgi:hypothetical protein